MNQFPGPPIFWECENSPNHWNHPDQLFRMLQESKLQPGFSWFFPTKNLGTRGAFEENTPWQRVHHDLGKMGLWCVPCFAVLPSIFGNVFFLYERKLYLFINRGDRALGAWFKFWKKNDPKQPYEKNPARVYIGKSLAPFANVMFQRALKNRGGFGFCSLKVIV